MTALARSRALLSFVLSALFFGCSTKDAYDATTVVIWHQMRPDERSILRSQLDRYERESGSGLRVVEVYKETEELRSGFVIASIAGQGPDLVYGPSDPVGIYEATRTIRPLESIVDSAFLDGIDSSGILSYKGHIFQLADKVGNHLALVYNKDFVSKPPETLDELIEIAQAIQKKYGSTANRPNVYGITWNYTEPFFFIPFLTGSGGWVFKNDGVTPNLDTPAMVKALEYIRNLRDVFGIVPNEADYEIADALFKDKKAAMMINGDWSWAGYIDKGLNIGVAPLPRMPSTGLWCAPMTSPKGYSMNVNVSDERIPVVRDLLQYLLSDSCQLENVRGLSTAPTAKRLKEHPEVLRDEILRNSLIQIERGRPMPVVPEMRAIWDAMRPSYQSVMGGNNPPSAQEAATAMQTLAVRKIRDMNE